MDRNILIPPFSMMLSVACMKHLDLHNNGVQRRVTFNVRHAQPRRHSFEQTTWEPVRHCSRRLRVFTGFGLFQCKTTLNRLIVFLALQIKQSCTR